ncbi:hypothetical protein [Actinomadura sp. 6N118]|uniref:hypothetical protein n=1 Tax=Actinomadura sp. 6N118 TaxID=3375151 RepID=UPI003799E4B5
MTNESRPEWAVRIQIEREVRKWSKYEMARQLMKAADLQQGEVDNLARQIRDHEKGRHFPREWAPAYAAAFTLTEAEIFGEPEQQSGSVDQRISDRSSQAVLRDPSAVNVDGAGTLDDWDDMERRRMLLTALGLGTLAATGEPIRQLLAQTLQSEQRTIEDWHLTYADHWHSLGRHSPVQVRDNLIIDLVALQHQVQTADARDLPELDRIVAALSAVHANVLTRLGEDGAAVRWWRTAKAAADRSGDLDLRLMVRADEAGCGLYGQRDLTTVIRLIDSAQNIAGDTPRSGLVMSVCHRAKALALMGNAREAHHTLTELLDLASAQSPTAQFGFRHSIVVSSIHFARSWVYAHTGDEPAADDARSHVLSTPGLDYQYATNVRLHEAQCAVENGGIDAGMQRASDILADLTPIQQSHVITETGKAVLRTVPLDQQDRPAVRQFREVLASTAPKLALTPGISSAV